MAKIEMEIGSTGHSERINFDNMDSQFDVSFCCTSSIAMTFQVAYEQLGLLYAKFFRRFVLLGVYSKKKYPFLSMQISKARMQEMKEVNGDAGLHVCKVCFESPTAAMLLPCRHFSKNGSYRDRCVNPFPLHVPSVQSARPRLQINLLLSLIDIKKTCEVSLEPPVPVPVPLVQTLREDHNTAFEQMA
ncbi:hypothetical protein OSB04_un000618 [Centaurea solstitialis]|uniref:Uncharacterized protein n=1 Tax=Centaurea solstitialis TaxID=347529 RepID=A0AA38W3F6_9ASTR|nr:hypothetical protein OSB04_un000618 [Centaurea solstitialis]